MMRGIKQGLEKLLSGALIAATVVSAPLAKATDSPPVPARDIQLPATYPNMAITINLEGVAVGSTNVYFSSGNTFNSANHALTQIYGGKINPTRPITDLGLDTQTGKLYQSISNRVCLLNPITGLVERSWVVGGTNKALSSTFLLNGNYVGTQIDSVSGIVNAYNYASSNVFATLGSFPTTATKKITGADSIIHLNKLYIFGLYDDTFRVMVADLSKPGYPSVFSPVEYRLVSSVQIGKLQDVGLSMDDSPQQNGLQPSAMVNMFLGASDLLGGAQFFKVKYDLRSFAPVEISPSYDKERNVMRVSYPDVFTNAVLQVAPFSSPTNWSDKTNGTAIINGGLITREYPASSLGELIRIRY